MITGSQFETSFTHSATRPHFRLIGTRLWSSRFLARDEQRALEEAVSSSRPVRAGSDLVSEGDGTDSLFIIVEGWACRYTTTTDGAHQISALLVPGDIVNLDALLLDRLDYSVRTLTEAKVVALPRTLILALGAQYTGIARTFTWLALVENVALSKLAHSLGRHSARERIAHLLCELSMRLNGEHENESRFDCPLTQEQFADALGLTTVHVNRTIQQLRKDGLIVTGSRMMILPDVGELRKVGGFDPRYLHMDQPISPKFF
ncbi:MAG: Crp/FNR family transcriptional regulator [Sphingomonadales bacterium]|nr:Crp/FNR family transcriptional regulator [Sphingomonadales bacterium]